MMASYTDSQNRLQDPELTYILAVGVCLTREGEGRDTRGNMVFLVSDPGKLETQRENQIVGLKMEDKIIELWERTDFHQLRCLQRGHKGVGRSPGGWKCLIPGPQVWRQTQWFASVVSALLWGDRTWGQEYCPVPRRPASLEYEYRSRNRRHPASKTRRKANPEKLSSDLLPHYPSTIQFLKDTSSSHRKKKNYNTSHCLKHWNKHWKLVFIRWQHCLEWEPKSLLSSPPDPQEEVRQLNRKGEKSYRL